MEISYQLECSFSGKAKIDCLKNYQNHEFINPKKEEVSQIRCNSDFRPKTLPKSSKTGSCVIKTSVSQHSRPTCRPTVSGHVNRQATDMSAESWSTCRSTVSCHSCQPTPSHTTPPLSQYFTDTRPAVHSFCQLLILSSIFSTQLLNNLS